MKKRFIKSISIILSLVMIATTLPYGMVAFAGDTIKGEVETIHLDSKTSDSRDTNINADWRFNMTTADCSSATYNDSSWSNIQLPHDFSIYQSFTTSGEAESGFLPGGTGWYRKKITIPASQNGKRFELNFDGAYMHTYVYVNGSYVGENHYGYNSFAFDITDKLTCDGTTENVIAVKVVHNTPSSRWYSGSGIYRDVTLTVTDPVHISHNGLTITTPNISSGNGTVNTVAKVQNQSSNAANVSVKATIYEKGSETAVATATSSSTSVAANSTSNITITPVVSSPKLWSVDNPNLYEAKIEVSVNGNVVDTYTDQFGFRYFSWTKSEGFKLNGNRLKLQGVCMHHDQGALGSAAYYDAMYRQMQSMKNMGVNSIRATHNPYSKDFYKICDELGLLVIEELYDGWAGPKNGNTHDFSEYWNTSLTSNNTIIGGGTSLTWPHFVMNEIVQRDVNRPSVFMWSLGNEIYEGYNTANQTVSNYLSIATQLKSWIKEDDPSRHFTIGDNHIKGEESAYTQVDAKLADSMFVLGMNYATDAQTQNIYNKYSYTIYGSETSSATNSRDRYMSQANNAAIDGAYHLTSFDTSAVGWGHTAQTSMLYTLSKDFNGGEYIWTGWDYIGEPTPWNGTGTGQANGGNGYTPNSSYFGIVDTAGFEKDTYYFYRSQWGDLVGNTTHLVTAWDSDNYMLVSSKVPVVLYSNAYKVEIYRNGTLMGTANRNDYSVGAAKYHTYSCTSNNGNCTTSSPSGAASLYATFNIAYEAGTLSTKSYDKSGNLINESTIEGRYKVSTPGNVSKIIMTKDKEEILADGSSLAYFTVDLTDASGNRDTMSSKLIKFDVSGEGDIMGCDNGDQASKQKFQQPSVMSQSNRKTAQIYAYAGKALCIVRSTKNAGTLTLTASSPNSEFDSVSQSVTTLSDGSSQTSIENGDINSYSFVRNYTVRKGNAPTFDTTATATKLGDSREYTGTVSWKNVPSSIYNNAGDYTIAGTLSVEGKSFNVTATLHVVDTISTLENISTVTYTKHIPSLPGTVKGLLDSGQASGEFEVTWDNMTSDMFANAGSIVEVNGTADVFSDIMDVKAFVRVEKPSVAVNDITNTVVEYSSDSQNTGFGALNDSNLSAKAWTNASTKNTSDVSYIQMRWDTARIISTIKLSYFFDSNAIAPEDIDIQVSNNGNDFESVGYTGPAEELQSGKLYEYKLDEIIDPIAIRIVFTQQGRTVTGNCVALSELKLYENKYSVVDANDSVSITDIKIDGVSVDGFNSKKTSYPNATVTESSVVTAQTDNNTAITVLPTVDGTVKIVTISEDGTDSKIYTLGVAIKPQPEATNIAISATKSHTNYDNNFSTIICDGRTGYDGNSSSYSENGKTGINNTNSWTGRGTSNRWCFAKFNWNDAKCITEAKVSFWADSGGTKMPNSFKIRYSSDGTNYEEIAYNDFTEDSSSTVPEKNYLPKKNKLMCTVMSTFDLASITSKPIRYIEFVSQQQGSDAVGLSEIEIYGYDAINDTTSEDGDWQIANSNDFTKSSLGTSTTNGNIRYNSVDSWNTLVYGTDASVSSNGLYIDDGFMYSDSLAQEIKKLDNFKIEYQFTTSSKTNFSTFNNTNMYNLSINGLKMPFIMLSSYTGSVVDSGSNIHSVENTSGNNIYNILGIGYGGEVYNHNSNICGLSSNKPINLSSSNKTYRVTIEYLNSNIKVSLYNVTDDVDATATADNVTVNTNEINRIYLTNAGHNDYLRGITYNYFNLYKYINNTNPVDPVDPEEPTGVIGAEGNTFNSAEQANNNYVKLNVNSNATTPSYLTTVKDNSNNIDSSFYSNLLYSSTDFAQGKEYNTNNTWVYLTGPRNSVLVYDGENDPGIPILLTVNAKAGSNISAFFISTDTNASNGNKTYGISYLNKNWVGNSTHVDTNAANAIKKWITGTSKTYHYLDNNSDAWALTGTGYYFNFGNTMYFSNSSLAGVDSLSNNYYVSYNSTRFGVSFKSSSNDHGNLIYLNNDTNSTCTQYVINYKAYKDLKNTVKTQYANTIGKYGLDGYTKDSVVEYINQIKNVCSFNINSYFPVSTTSDSNVSSNVQTYASDLKSLITAYNAAYNALRRQYYVEFKLGDSTVQKQYFTESGVIPAKPDDVIVSGNADNNYNHMVYSWNDIKPTASSDVTYTAKVINSEPCNNKNGSVTGNSANIVCSVCNSSNTVDLSSYKAAVDFLNNLLANTDKYKTQAIKNFESKLKSISVINTDNSISAFVSQNELDAITTEIQSLVTQLDTRINIKRFDVNYSYQKNNDVIDDAQGLIVDARYDDWLTSSGYSLGENESVYKWTVDDNNGTVKTIYNTTTNYNIYVNKDMDLICYVTDGTEVAPDGQYKVEFINQVGRTSNIEFCENGTSYTVDADTVKDSAGNVVYTAPSVPFYQVQGFRVGGTTFTTGESFSITNDTKVYPVYVVESSFKIFTTGEFAASALINGESHHTESKAYTANWDEEINVLFNAGESRALYWYVNGVLSGYGTSFKFRACCDANISASNMENKDVPTIAVNYFKYDVDNNKATAVITFYNAGATVDEVGVILSTTATTKQDVINKGKKFVANRYTGNNNQAKISVTRTATNPFTMYAVPYIIVNGTTYYGEVSAPIIYNP